MFEELREYFTGRVDHVRDLAGRASPGPLLVRAAVAVLAALSMVLAFPAVVVHNIGAVGIAAVVALLPATFPRTRLVGLAIFACLFGWLIGTLLYAEPIDTLRLVGLATALYLLHSTAALAAVLPYDCVLSPGVLVGWLLRAGTIVAVSALVSVALLVVVKLTVGPVFLVASLVGVVVAGALVYLVARRA